MLYGPQNFSDQSQCDAIGTGVTGVSSDHASQESIHSHSTQHVQSDTGQNSVYIQSGDYDTDQAVHYLVNTGQGLHPSQVGLNLPGTISDTHMQSVRYFMNDSDTDQTVHAQSMSREIVGSENISPSQTDMGLQNMQRMSENHATRLIQTGSFSGSQEDIRSDATLSNAQTGVGLGSSTLHGSQTENFIVGSGDNTTSQPNHETFSSVLQNFCFVISQPGTYIMKTHRKPNEQLFFQ